MSVGLLDHYNIRTANLTATVDFYETMLGLEDGDRPACNFPGTWHIAFVSKGFEAMKRHLEGAGYRFEARGVPGGKLWQIFVRDPNGLLTGLNYDAQAEQAAA